MLSNLSLRGGHRPTWQSRSTRTDHRKATGENVAGCRRFPRRFAPRNDKPVCLTPPNYYCNTCDCLWRSLSAATDAIGAYHFTLTSMGRKCLPEIATGAKRPRNDKSIAFSILTVAGTNRLCCAGPGCPLPYNARPETFCLPQALQYSARNVAFFSGTC